MALHALLPAVLVGAAIQRLYLAARRRISEAHRDESLDWRPTKVLAGLAVGMSILAIVRVPSLALDDIAMGVVCAGTGYISFLALALRLSAGGPGFSWAALLPAAYVVLPGLPLALFGGSHEASDVFLLYFILPGYIGIVAGSLVALLFAEVAIRVFLRKRREAAAEPEVPEARVVDE